MTIPALDRGVYQVVYNGNVYSLELMYGSEIPVICIDTETGSLGEVYANKSYKESGTIIIADGSETVYNGGLDYIKGRGNSTWHNPKKPFNIKLDEKTELFGMEKNKSWSLLANYTDVTALKNIISLELADKVGINFVPQTQTIDLYINNRYMGIYTLIEKVEIGDGRVDITDLEALNEEANPDIDIEECARAGETDNYIRGAAKYIDIPSDPRDITGGYILEYDFWDRYYDELSGFMTNHLRAVVIKSPEYASKAETEYIKDYFMAFEDAVRNADGINSEGKHYSDYVDMDSLVKLYLLNEYTKNHDAGLSSTYFYKDAGKKIYAGPAWDFDLSLGEAGERSGIDMASPEHFAVSAMQRTEDDQPVIYGLINQRPEVREQVVKCWNEIYSPVMDDLAAEYTARLEEIKDSVIINAIMWASFEEYESPQQRVDSEYNIVYNFLVYRADYMDKMLTAQSNCIYYEPNGATGEMIDANWYIDGDVATVKVSEFENENKTFYGWNTKPNGRGAVYTPGEEIEMKESIVLYAQWEESTGINKLLSAIATFFK